MTHKRTTIFSVSCDRDKIARAIDVTQYQGRGAIAGALWFGVVSVMFSKIAFAF
jgi:hypothetical protein